MGYVYSGNSSWGCLMVSSVCRVFPNRGCRAGSACVCDFDGKLMGVAQGLQGVSSCQHGRKRVGLGREAG